MKPDPFKLDLGGIVSRSLGASNPAVAKTPRF